VATREDRRARNEHLFRSANERIRESGGRLLPSGDNPVVCECYKATCTRVIRLNDAELDAVRRHPNRFVVVPGHDHAEERVIEQRAHYAIVEKA
jgi:hypothetical protein